MTRLRQPTRCRAVSDGRHVSETSDLRGCDILRDPLSDQLEEVRRLMMVMMRVQGVTSAAALR